MCFIENIFATEFFHDMNKHISLKYVIFILTKKPIGGTDSKGCSLLSDLALNLKNIDNKLINANPPAMEGQAFFIYTLIK
jgi:hypothetical protein